MFRRLRGITGQSTAEYAVIIGVVVAVAIAMQTYVKRGVQGRMKNELDDMVAQTNELGPTKQYEPYYMQSDYTTTTNYDTRVTSQTAKNPKKEIESSATTVGTQTVLGVP